MRKRKSKSTRPTKGKFQLSRAHIPLKHNRGKKPCLYCRQSSHNNCRPRLWADELCTCSCPKSEAIKLELQLLQKDRAKQGLEPTSITEGWKLIKQYFGNYYEIEQICKTKKIRALFNKTETK